jgi:uncharacterized membrane protein
MKIFATYAIALVSFLSIDAVWLGVIATNMYKKYIGHILGPVNFTAAALFYLLYIAGLTYFILHPALQSPKPVWQVALNGALLSALCYATYDLTNQATVKDWPWRITVIDITWGFILGGAVCAVTYAIVRRIWM